MTEVHITADTDCWTGASTLALHAARSCGSGAVVITAGDAEMAGRIEASGVTAIRCPMEGWFGSLNLSRALRSLSGDSFKVVVHSPKIMPTVENALKLVGRKEPMTLCRPEPVGAFPAVEVERPAPDAAPLLMWLGNITPDCGLHNLIEYLSTRRDEAWSLRVVGQGKARVVSPLLKRTKALGIADRIEWVGYSANPYERMNGVSAGIVTVASGSDSVVAREFRAASIPVITDFSEILS